MMLSPLLIFLLSILPTSQAFQNHITHLSSIHSHKKSINHPTKHQSILSSSDSITYTPTLISITFTYLSLLLFYDRPQGSLPSRDDLSIAPSRVPNAGLGLFVTVDLPEGTVLGTYPGVLRSQDDFYNGKCRVYPQSVYYSWRLNDSGYVLDPTDGNGEIQSYCYGGSDVVSEVIFLSLLRFCAKPTHLARINEPPLGFGGCNVVAREDKENKCVRFELCRDVKMGEELFMDYGLDYDRSGYVR